MKQLLYFLFITIIFTNLARASFAATPTPSSDSTASESGLLNRIEKIKELVASRVAELKLVEKRGLLGVVKESSNTQITIEDSAGIAKFIDIDELTKFEDSTNKSFGISDVKKGNLLSAIGLYNKDSKRLLARVIVTVKSLPIQIDGVVESKNTKDFTINVVDEKGGRKIIDVERSTTTQSHSSSDGLIKSGFTKIEDGQRILITGFTALNDPNRIAASRIIHFTDVPPSPEIQKHTTVAESAPTSSIQATIAPTKATSR